MLGLGALAVLVRLVHLWAFADSPTFLIPVLDSQNYDLIARRLVAGQGANADLFWQPMFYPVTLAGVYALAGGSVVAAKMFQTLLAGITGGLVYWLGQRTMSRRAGIGASVITAFYGPLVFYDGELLANVWAGLWAVLLLVLLLQAAARGRLWLMGLFGLCAGLSVLTRPTFLPFVGLSMIWLAVRWYRDGRGWRLPLAGAAITALVFVVVTAPAAYWCYRATGRASIMPTSRGYNLYLGNNPQSEQTEAISPWAVVRDRQRAAEQGFPGPWGENEYFSGLFWEYVWNEPGSFMRGLLHKTFLFITAREVPSYEDVYYQGQWSWVLAALNWRVGRFGLPFGVLLPLAILGAVYGWRRWPLPLILLPVLECAAISAAHVVGRTRTTMIPVLAIFAVAGVIAALDIWRRRRWGWGLGAVAGAGALIPLMTIPGPFGLESFNSQAEIPLAIGFYRYVQLEDLPGAIEAYRQALKAAPDNAGAHFDLAIALRDRSDVEGAIEHYRAAIRLAPDYAAFRYNLANTLLRANRTDAAIEEYREALRIYPGWPDVHNNLAYALAAKGDRTAAMAEYREATRLKPDFAQAWEGLGQVCRQSGDLEQALAAYQAAVKLQPDDAFLYCRVGDLKALLGRPREAADFYLRALQLNPRSQAAVAGLERLRNPTATRSAPATQP